MRNYRHSRDSQKWKERSVRPNSSGLLVAIRTTSIYARSPRHKLRPLCTVLARSMSQPIHRASIVSERSRRVHRPFLICKRDAPGSDAPLCCFRGRRSRYERPEVAQAAKVADTESAQMNFCSALTGIPQILSWNNLHLLVGSLFTSEILLLFKP